MTKLPLSARMILVLTMITILSGGILAAWDAYTEPRIEYHRLEALKAAIANVLPPHDHYTTKETGIGNLYLASREDTLMGVAFMAVGNGFQGELRIMVGLTPDLGKITGIKVLEQIETPGLGTKIVVDPSNKADPYWFTAQFRDLHTAPDLVVIKNSQPSQKHEVQGITGATISSQAVTRIINQTIVGVKMAMTTSRELES